MTIYVAHNTPAGPVMQAQDANAEFVRIADERGNYIDVRYDASSATWIVDTRVTGMVISERRNMNTCSTELHIRGDK